MSFGDWNDALAVPGLYVISEFDVYVVIRLSFSLRWMKVVWIFII